ncbi:MAG: hypothetical protein EBZ28_08095, partial [Alphaproteobacteria bacterium]|nr:hypothetical protein [Alphaproteobacteria bacterium]
LQAPTINGTTTVISQLFNGGKFNGTEANLSGTLNANKVLAVANVNGVTADFTDLIASNSVNGKSLLVNGNTFDLDTTFEQGSILYASSANTLTKLTKGSEDQILTVNGNILSWQTPGAGADNLGDHTATQDLDMGTNSITNAANGTFSNILSAATINGTSTVISALFNGGKFNGTEANLSGTVNANKILATANVNGTDATFTGTLQAPTINGTTTVISQLFNGGKFNGTEANLSGTLNANKVISSSNINGTTITLSSGATAGYVLTSDATGNATWQDLATLTSNGDDLGTHTATQDLDMGTNSITNAANGTFSNILSAATINGTSTVISALFNGGKFNGTEANLSGTLNANKV